MRSKKDAPRTPSNSRAHLSALKRSEKGFCLGMAFLARLSGALCGYQGVGVDHLAALGAHMQTLLLFFVGRVGDLADLKYFGLYAQDSPKRFENLWRAPKRCCALYAVPQKSPTESYLVIIIFFGPLDSLENRRGVRLESRGRPCASRRRPQGAVVGSVAPPERRPWSPRPT